MSKKLVALFAAILVMASCTQGGPKQTAGTYIGAAGGALLGSQFGKGDGRLVAIALGTLIGSQVGGHVGANMDEKDKQLASQAAYKGLEHTPDNKVTAWRNPNKNHRGDFVVTNTEEYNSKVCRSYNHTVYIDGEREVVHGRACRKLSDPSGKWYISN